MISFYERFLLKKQSEINKKLSIQQERVDNRTAEMLSKPCPIARMNNCFENCVHFRHGYAVYIEKVCEVLSCPPHCKLWN